MTRLELQTAILDLLKMVRDDELVVLDADGACTCDECLELKAFELAAKALPDKETKDES